MCRFVRRFLCFCGVSVLCCPSCVYLVFWCLWDSLVYVFSMSVGVAGGVGVAGVIAAVVAVGVVGGSGVAYAVGVAGVVGLVGVIG